MPFNSDIRQFSDVVGLSAYLGRLPRPTWGVKGSTGHNTYRPTEAQWRGLRSMDSMQDGYEAKGWTAGPHFYLACHSPNPKHDGIWTMTPPTSPGVHGVACNSTHFGIEVVGDFQSKAPSATQQDLLIDVLTTLHRWARLGPTFNMHRDCVPRTCPGDAFYALKPQLQARLAAQLTTSTMPNPLRAAQLPGPNATIRYCSSPMSAFYAQHGAVGFFGYPLNDETADTGLDGRVCSYLTCERAVIKRVEPEGVHLALSSEARERKWF